MHKKYAVDTNVLLDNPDCISILINGDENSVCIPSHVLMELDKLKKDNKTEYLANRAIKSIEENIHKIEILNNSESSSEITRDIDHFIFNEVKKEEEITLVSNDRIANLRAPKLYNINVEDFKKSKPYLSDSQHYTGFIDKQRDELIPNCFYWEDGHPIYNSNDGQQKIDFDKDSWNITTKNVYQNLMLTLCEDPNVHIVSVQSPAGLGKTFLALASSFLQTLQQKRFNKIYVAKSTKEWEGPGYLPGSLDDKIGPSFEYLRPLVQKLHSIRKANRIFEDPDNLDKGYDSKNFELLPLYYLKGRNIENSIVIVDEAQDISRESMRVLLTRMGENAKVILLGDTNQVSNPYLNPLNNGLNWVTRKLKGYNIYGHLVLKGKKSRGPITDAILKSGL